ncbi:MAG: CHAD domain-containing protein [Verrucomicrobia bacterium]|nr:CHAD domain-containing protein [Verrucomicrobiota bacterium]
MPSAFADYGAPDSQGFCEPPSAVATEALRSRATIGVSLPQRKQPLHQAGANFLRVQELGAANVHSGEMPLKRKESLRKGLQRISQTRLHSVLQIIVREGPTAESVHEARKIVESLRAILRLARGALSTGARKERNQVLRDFAGSFSRQRDAAVTLGTFAKVYSASLDGKREQAPKPQWATRLQKSLKAEAHATLPAEYYQDAVERLRRFNGQLLIFEDRACQASSRSQSEDDWDAMVAEGLRKTYRQGRRLLREISAAAEPSDELCHELRKRVKDLGYQLALHKKIEGVRPKLAKLGEVGDALGDARDLILLRGFISRLPKKCHLSPADRESYHCVLTSVDARRHQLYQHALQVGRRVYRRGSERFTRRMAKRWRQWKGS